MKIIKRGKLPEKTEVEETCYKCGTVFSYIGEDIQADSRDGDYVECPVCKTFITVKRVLTSKIKL